MKKILLSSFLFVGMISHGALAAKAYSSESSDSEGDLAPMRSMKKVMAQKFDPRLMLEMSEEERTLHLKLMADMSEAAGYLDSIGSKTKAAKDAAKLTKVQIRREKAKLKKLEREERDDAAFSRQEREVGLANAQADLGIKLHNHGMDMRTRALKAQEEEHDLHRRLEDAKTGVFGKTKRFFMGREEAPVSDVARRAAERVAMLEGAVTDGMRRMALEGGRPPAGAPRGVRLELASDSD